MMLFTTLPTVSFALVLMLGAFQGSNLNDGRPSSSVHARVPVSTLHLPSVTPRDSTPLYTEEQATAGEAIFSKICAECHEKKDINGADFRAKWTGRPLFDLYELIRTTMPDSNPGAMSRDEYAAALAYILKQNGLPAGSKAVMPDSAAMQGAKLELPPPAL